VIFEEIKELHSRLRTEGRRNAVKTARAARRSSGRRPVAG
jgi:hypothetical protein